MEVALSTAAPPQTRPFFDLHPEIRNQIYRYLFQGQTIKIRNQDVMTKKERKRFSATIKEAKKNHAIVRDRKIGTNILFTCKQILAEAKPLLLNIAVFNISFDCLLSKACGAGGPILRRQQGSTEDDLALVHALGIDGCPMDQQKAWAVILAMPLLQELILLDSMMTGDQLFQEHEPDRYRLICREKARWEETDAILYRDIFNDKAWLVREDNEEILVPKYFGKGPPPE